MPEETVGVGHKAADRKQKTIALLKRHGHLLAIVAGTAAIVTSVVTAASVCRETRIREAAHHKLQEAFLAVLPFYEKVRLIEARYGGPAQAEEAHARLEPKLRDIATGDVSEPSLPAYFDGLELREYMIARDNRRYFIIGKLELQHIDDEEAAAILTAYRSVRPGTNAVTLGSVPFEDEQLVQEMIAAME